MPSPKSRHDLTPDAPSAVLHGDGIESGFIGRLQGLKYDSRPDITHRGALKQSPASRQDPGFEAAFLRSQQGNLPSPSLPA